MGITVEGGSIVIDEVTLTLNNAFSPNSGIMTLTITPAGGLGTFASLLVGGGSGGVVPPPTIEIGTVTTLPPESQATATLTQVSPGSTGSTTSAPSPPIYKLNLSVPEGQQGQPSVFSINGAEDLVSDFVNNLRNGVTLAWDAVSQLWAPVEQAITHVYTPSYINSTSGTSTGPRILTKITIPAHSQAFIPQAHGTCLINGTANTVVNLGAFINSPSGQQIGAGFGSPGVPTQTVTLTPGMPAGSPTGANVVPAGTGATIVFTATQVGSTTDPWSTNAWSTHFSVTAALQGAVTSVPTFSTGT